jgi:hypothetical protein
MKRRVQKKTAEEKSGSQLQSTRVPAQAASDVAIPRKDKEKVAKKLFSDLQQRPSAPRITKALLRSYPPQYAKGVPSPVSSPFVRGQWGSFLESSDQKKISGDYRDIVTSPQPGFAAIFLSEAYERIREMEFESGVAELASLLELIRHNPHFKVEIEAMRMLVQGESVLEQFSAKIRSM